MLQSPFFCEIEYKMSDKYESLELKASYGVGLNMGGQLLGQAFDGLDIKVSVQSISI